MGNREKFCSRLRKSHSTKNIDRLTLLKYMYKLGYSETELSQQHPYKLKNPDALDQYLKGSHDKRNNIPYCFQEILNPIKPKNEERVVIHKREDDF